MKEFVIDDPEIGSSIFRDAIKHKMENKEFLYNRLSSLNRYIVDNTILNLLQEKKENIECKFGTYFTLLLDQENMKRSYSRFNNKPLSTVYLSQLIYAYARYSGYNYNLTNELRGLLEKFKTLKNKPQSKSEDVVNCLCDILSVSKDVLYYGHGIRYIIDWNYISLLLKERDMDEDKFHEQIIKNYTQCIDSKINDDEYILYLEYMLYNQKKYGQFIADTLEVQYSDIILENSISLLDDDENIIWDYFNNLTKKEQFVIYQLIKNLHLTVSKE